MTLHLAGSGPSREAELCLHPGSTSAPKIGEVPLQWTWKESPRDGPMKQSQVFVMFLENCTTNITYDIDTKKSSADLYTRNYGTFPH